FATGTIDSIDGLRSQPNVVYFGVTNDGLYRTDDAGKSWRRVFEGNVRAVTVDPTDERVVYVGIEPIHLYRTEDGGKSWDELTGVQDLPAQVKAKWTYPQSPHREHVRHIFVHPDEPNVLHVCLDHGGIIRSRDLAENWERVGTGDWLPENMKQMVWALTQHPEDPLCTPVLAPCHAGVRRMLRKKAVGTYW